jgi:alpha-D-ribose 1-methylphosphonate 5-triphosphate synthase subunit PhnG
MLTQRESARNTLFHPGEVLTSETKAQVDGAIGLGILIGDDLAASEELALIDGAWNAGCSFAAEWLPSLLEENEALELRQGRDNAAILRTKVDFQTMAAEPVL